MALAARPIAGSAAARLRSLGQGTVEYIGMVVMVTLLVAAVAAAAKGWAHDIGSALKRALTTAVRKLSGAMDG